MSADLQHPSADITLWAHGDQRVEVSPIHVPGGFHIVHLGAWPVTAVLFLDHATAVSIRDRLSAAIQDAEQHVMAHRDNPEIREPDHYAPDLVCDRCNGPMSIMEHRALGHCAACEHGIPIPPPAAPEQPHKVMRHCAVCQDLTDEREISPDGYCPRCYVHAHGY